MTRTHDEFGRLEIWFLTGSVSLYGDEVLRQVAEQSQQVARQLDEADELPIHIVWKPVLADTESIRAIAAEADAAEHVVGLIAWMHTFSPAKMWITGLAGLRTPLLHLHTQTGAQLPYSEIDFDFMNLNQSAHGDREFAYIQTRMGIARSTVVGHASSSTTRGRIATWMRAAAGWNAIRTLRVARFGDNMRYVAVTEGDKTEAEIRLGVQVNTWSVNELADAVERATDTAIDALVAEYEELYDVSAELRRGGDRHSSLRDGAAIEIGLRSFLEEGGFRAFTTTFEDLGRLTQLPGLAVQRLIADGYGFGPEGDWKSAVLGRAAAVMGQGLSGGASIMEDYTYDLTEGSEVILGAHMLEVSHVLTTRRPSLEVHPLGIGGKPDPVRLVFTADAGRGVVVSLTDMRERFRMVANAVQLIDEPEPLTSLPVGRALWRPEPDFTTATSAWLMAGGAHHTVLSTALGVDAFAELARMAGVEFAVIDEKTTLREFENNLRWNQAYYRLGQGF